MVESRQHGICHPGDSNVIRVLTACNKSSDIHVVIQELFHRWQLVLKTFERDSGIRRKKYIGKGAQPRNSSWVWMDSPMQRRGW
jgi:hypothetical protein